jgi:acyl-CoA thioester hydrolase
MKTVEIERELPVRTYDIDFAGVVSNIVYLRWLEDLRLAVLEECYPLERFLADSLHLTLAETRIKYKRPILLLDKPIAHMRIGPVSKARITFNGEIHVGDKLVTESQQIACVVEASSGRPRSLPTELFRYFHAPSDSP